MRCGLEDTVAQDAPCLEMLVQQQSQRKEEEKWKMSAKQSLLSALKGGSVPFVLFVDVVVITIIQYICEISKHE